MRRLLPLALLAAACGGPAAAATSEPTSARPGEPRVSEPSVAEGVLAMDSVCFEQERCDGLDSDCDGRIDEACASVESDLQIGLAWNDGSSLEVRVAPDADAVLAEQPEAACDDETVPRVARRFHGPLADGDYQVSVVRTDACPAADGTRASVAVSAFGRLLGTYVLEVGSDPVDVVSFTVRR